jgi:NAD-dependent dihydropyrimidine dehydrogenase PreA subunit
VPAPSTPAPVARFVARGRPAADPGCAGCAQLGLFRALRRAGLDVQGGPGCDPASPVAFAAAPGRWAAVSGARRVLQDPRAVLSSAAGSGARLVVVADAATARTDGVGAALAAAGVRVVRVDPADLAAAEATARAEADAGGAVLVALSPCRRGAASSRPFTIAASRCNRCGACLGLGCPALSDPGGDAIAIDGATCTGCGLCAPLCRARAIWR